MVDLSPGRQSRREGLLIVSGGCLEDLDDRAVLLGVVEHGAEEARAEVVFGRGAADAAGVVRLGERSAAPVGQVVGDAAAEEQRQSGRGRGGGCGGEGDENQD